MSVSVLPPESTTGDLQSVLLGETTTDALGRFELVRCNGAMPVSDLGDGSYMLVFTGGDEANFVYTEAIMKQPTTLGAAWTLADAPQAYTGGTAPLESVNGGETEVGTVGIVTEAHAAGDGAELENPVYEDENGNPQDPTILDDPPSGMMNTMAIPTSVCSGSVSYTATNTYTRAWVPIQRFKTRTRLGASFGWSTTKETSLGVAMTGSKGKYNVGLSKSLTNNTATGMSVNANTNSAFRTDVEWRYRGYKVTCWPVGSNAPVATGQIAWRPYNWTGGNRNAISQPTWSCVASRTVSLANAIWVARDRTVTWSGNYSIGGVSLSNSQRTSTSAKLTLIPKASGAKACGSNSTPTTAAQVQEAP
ncbi:hypothetical protein V5D56_07060 [Cellulosimicrobium sp. PMB13]|uniref:hypothetical protein n=1 Tax=Cellulosimicrobium sp. PMB13 TaxID=3120158 RepID=UPI003F4C6E1C